MDDEIKQGSLEFQDEDAQDQTAATDDGVLVAEVAPETEEQAKEEATAGVVKKISESLKDDEGERSKIELMDFVTGRILERAWFRRQIPFIILIVALTIVYISNRYAAQQEIMQLDKLRQQLVVTRNYATACSAEVVERLRESKVIEFLKHTPDSDLTHASEPPVRIKLD